MRHEHFRVACRVVVLVVVGLGLVMAGPRSVAHVKPFAVLPSAGSPVASPAVGPGDE